MKIDICYTPELIHQFDVSDKCVVVIDVLRATSCMVAGLGSGVKSIKPVATVEECEALGAQGYVMAGERGGKKLDQFDIGNSPFDYMQSQFKGKDIAATTTNGTRAIELSKEAPEVIIGSFLNLSAIVDHLASQSRDILLFCAGWKGRYNLEDSLFAGAICDGLKKHAEFTSDAVTAAFYLYESMQKDLFYYISRSNHAARLSKFGILKDIEYCSRTDEFEVVPKLNNGALTI
ncbi:2-phosphosulfolactate phosphatase [Roseivirga sp. E12]|uniref:2-phosphosulfolactate phosphatase n=1 Tax=Roseivirga sp. E12 TaxID=2819237 RepID=UPI001ABD1BD3|nr:2-phosphosulfolactate phosphatase [Roseivirga sp. E12]MBO3700018.1 2-phosphosulfolactate phosphatase [Roseivirga sp. E12]